MSMSVGIELRVAFVSPKFTFTRRHESAGQPRPSRFWILVRIQMTNTGKQTQVPKKAYNPQFGDILKECIQLEELEEYRKRYCFQHDPPQPLRFLRNAPTKRLSFHHRSPPFSTRIEDNDLRAFIPDTSKIPKAHKLPPLSSYFLTTLVNGLLRIDRDMLQSRIQLQTPA
jgi:hypothetical protein